MNVCVVDFRPRRRASDFADGSGHDATSAHPLPLRVTTAVMKNREDLLRRLKGTFLREAFAPCVEAELRRSFPMSPPPPAPPGSDMRDRIRHGVLWRGRWGYIGHLAATSAEYVLLEEANGRRPTMDEFLVLRHARWSLEGTATGLELTPRQVFDAFRQAVSYAKAGSAWSEYQATDWSAVASDAWPLFEASRLAHQQAEAAKRTRYPNHGKRWHEDEDARLTHLFQAGIRAGELLARHPAYTGDPFLARLTEETGRTPVAIHQRLVKLGLVQP